MSVSFNPRFAGTPPTAKTPTGGAEAQPVGNSGSGEILVDEDTGQRFRVTTLKSSAAPSLAKLALDESKKVEAQIATADRKGLAGIIGNLADLFTQENPGILESAVRTRLATAIQLREHQLDEQG